MIIYNNIKELEIAGQLNPDSIVNADCLEAMKFIPDKSVDMILCDLPYGTTQNKWDVIIPFDKLWEQYLRIIKDNGAIVLTGSQPFTSLLICSNINNFKQSLIWEKNIASNFLNANKQHMMRHEDICIFYKKQVVFNKQVIKGLPYINKRKGKDDTGDNYGFIKQRTNTINIGNRNPVSILKFDREVGMHPTQKPVSLMEYLIKTYTNEGQTVLGNCMGSGTTGIACKNLNRDFIGIEKDENYFNISIERIENTKQKNQ